ncbi:amino acid permease [Wohlfahrtiimonas chitiniclastica]|uniref:amino acid permease n=1 Tax=Wohlfahrtiimonas chitiniclastica TaxID=400946 RepID=UPI0007B69979|nr:amino acid permease [Wohlfahrtiimonas chitiniclastica]KZX37084.1 transporter [Wohlfahrtiimonas chitiniclastica]
MSMQPKKMSVWTLAIMTVAAVCSLRGLPMMAKEGTEMFFFLGFSILLFLLPASLVAAELGSAFSQKKGGVYTWVGAAFGNKWGFTAIWLQWIQNVVWYPSVLAFAAAALAYLIGQPDLANSGIYTGSVIIVFYWIATFISLKGSNFASKVTSIGTIVGTILPGVLIIVLGIFWYLGDNPNHMFDVTKTATGSMVHARFMPHLTDLSSLAFLGGIILLFAGVEVHAVHASDLENPRTQFPRAIFLAAIIILLLFVLGSASLAIMIPNEEIDLNQGLMQAFLISLDHFNLHWLVAPLGLFIAFGAFAGVMSWITGPSRGLLETAQEGEIPPLLAKTNKNGVQQNILLIQGVIVTILSSLYFFMDNVSVAFFLLSAMTITLYLVMYMLMYATGIKLRYTQPDLPRAYKVPGGKMGMNTIAGVGLFGVLFAFTVSFVPPSQLPIGNPTLYVALVTSGFVIFCGLPLLIQAFKKPSWKQNKQTS